MQRLQFDSGEQISRKEYLKRKRRNSKLLRKRSKITYILMASFVVLALYIAIQFVIYKRYNSYKYTSGEEVDSQNVYNIFFVTEGYTYDPIYSVSTILSSGQNETSILPSSNIEQINVGKDSIYGLKEGAICIINRKNYEVSELISDNIKKYVVQNNYIFYTSNDEERLKSYNMDTGEKQEFDAVNVKQILASDNYVFGITHNTTDRAIYRFDYNGQNKTKISGDEKVSYAIEDNNIIYFVNRGDNDKIYKVNADGNGMSKVADIRGVSPKGELKEVNGKKYMFIKDNKLYYINTDNEGTLWCYDLSTNENKQIISAPIEILQNVDNTVFYKINKEMGVYLYNYETNFMSLVTKRRVKEFVIDPYNIIKNEPIMEE